jgi:hypothetical protein
MSNFCKGLLVLAIIFLPAIAGAQSRTSYEGSWQKLLTHFSACSSQHGFDPQSPQQPPQDRLAKGELDWRACAYQGIENIMIPNSTVPGLFQQLIREDKAMTARIAGGELKRSERKARVLAILEDIRSREDAGRKAEDARIKKEFGKFERSYNRAARRAVRGFF